MEEIHIGNEITKRLQELHMTKTEFARRLGKISQNINRILRDPTIKTDILEKVCDVLDYDFFALYQKRRSGHVNIVASGDSSIAALNSEINTTDASILQERIRNLEMLLQEKERLIQVLLRGGQHNVK